MRMNERTMRFSRLFHRGCSPAKKTSAAALCHCDGKAATSPEYMALATSDRAASALQIDEGEWSSNTKHTPSSTGLPEEWKS